MKNKKKFLISLLIFFILISIAHFNSFFYKLYVINNNNLEKRLIDTYGYCDGPSYGFIKYIYKKYMIKENILIVDGKYPSKIKSEWFFYEISKPLNIRKIILINNNKNLIKYKNFYMIKYKNKVYDNLNIVEKKNNCYYLKND